MEQGIQGTEHGVERRSRGGGGGGVDMDQGARDTEQGFSDMEQGVWDIEGKGLGHTAGGSEHEAPDLAKALRIAVSSWAEY